MGKADKKLKEFINDLHEFGRFQWKELDGFKTDSHNAARFWTWLDNHVKQGILFDLLILSLILCIGNWRNTACASVSKPRLAGFDWLVVTNHLSSPA